MSAAVWSAKCASMAERRLSGWDSNWVYFFEGVVLLAAVMLNTAIKRRAERAR